jgi:cephalosporin-C deacetylase-like acetyl esterase
VIPTALEKLRSVAADVAPSREVVVGGGPMVGLFFEGEPVRGRPTKVFAYLGRPGRSDSRRAAIVLVHGGGGQAFAEWVTMWVQRGYVALAVDLSGGGPGGAPHAEAGPLPDDTGVFTSIADGEQNTWMYHSVSAVLRSVAILLEDSEVDPDRVFLYGISWGAHVAQLAASIDPRVRRACFLYGAGFLAEGPLIADALAALPADAAERWLAEFDQSNHLHRIAVPTLWITGANDNCYPLGAFVRSAALVATPALMRITPGLEHSHVHGWSPIEPFEFFEEAAGGALLPRLGAMTVDGSVVDATVSADLPILAANLHHTTDAGPWVARRWTTTDAQVSHHTVTAPLSSPDATVMLSVTDLRGATTSTGVVSS